MRLQVSGKRSNQAVGLTESNYMFGINALVPFSVGRWTSVFEGEIGRSSVAGMYQLGGAGRMPGVPYGRWSGSRLEYAKASLMRNVSDWMPFVCRCGLAEHLRQGVLGMMCTDCRATLKMSVRGLNPFRHRSALTV